MDQTPSSPSKGDASASSGDKDKKKKKFRSVYNFNITNQSLLVDDVANWLWGSKIKMKIEQSNDDGTVKFFDDDDDDDEEDGIVRAKRWRDKCVKWKQQQLQQQQQHNNGFIFPFPLSRAPSFLKTKKKSGKSKGDKEGGETPSDEKKDKEKSAASQQ